MKKKELNYKELHLRFNKLRVEMKMNGQPFTRNELKDCMSKIGIHFDDYHFKILEETLGWLDRMGNGRNTRYFWHDLKGHDGSEVNPSLQSFIRIYDEACKLRNADSRKYYKNKRQVETSVKAPVSANEELQHAIEIVKKAGIHCIKTIKMYDGTEHIIEI